MEGYLKLHRQILDSTQFADPIRLKIWIWCLVRANHKKKAVSLKTGKGFTTVTVNRGQFIFGRNKAADELNIPASTVLRHMEKLQEENAINISSDNQYSVITICKYEEYQSIEEKSEQPTDNQRTTNGLASDTNNNDNNKKNDKKEKKKDITEASSVYSECMALYNDFIICRTNVAAKIDAKGGAALKKIIKYFESQVKDKDDPMAVQKAVEFIFHHYNLWDSFHQKQITLNQIESNLINIINSIRNANRNGQITKNKLTSKYAPSI